MSNEGMDKPLNLQGYSELPQFGIAIAPPDNNPQLWMTVGYGTAQMQFYLCGTDNYEEVARQFHKNIMDAGLAAKRARSGIVVAKGNHDATLRQAQGGQQRSQGRKGT